MKTPQIALSAVVFLGSLVLLPAADAQQDAAAASPTADRAAAFQEEQNKALVMRFYEEAWHDDNYAFADEFFAPDYIRHDASLPVPGPGNAPLQSEIARRAKRYMPDLRYTSYDVVMAEDDRVAVRFTSRGTPAGFPAVIRRLVGKSGPIEMTGVNIYRIRNGKVAEIWINRDDLAILRETGVFRWYGVGIFLAGVLVALLVSWGVGRLRGSRRGAREPAYT